MSGESLPITTSGFAEAIKELPISAVYSKVSELRNSILHLHRSNDELRSFINDSCESEDDKRELESYIAENASVIASMETRIMLLRAEVENRGQLWIEVENPTDANAVGNQEMRATANGADADGTGPEAVTTDVHHGSTSRGTPANEPSGNRNEENEQDGVYL
ncbi:hypothetical protein PHISCL_02896 [Aspergillus sclerotialis]|uniref:Uncharacterized protein n=1 Tax=Aspergillus sclerotialis TaxID=2070753 RepID=A0A3A3A5W6_9EURO|nr:hypothetical protein PHISCL_02896 [Aspergillus sclerotialis]